MKLILTGLVLLCFFNIHCSKETAAGGPRFTGELVKNGPCSHYVIQLISGNMDSTDLVASWYDRDRDTTYKNVFTVANYCTFGDYGLHQGDIISFQLQPIVPAQNCAICLIAVAVPAKANAIINVQKVK